MHDDADVGTERNKEGYWGWSRSLLPNDLKTLGYELIYVRIECTMLRVANDFNHSGVKSIFDSW